MNENKKNPRQRPS